MALKIVTGGTTGAADGTLVSSSNKITFTALDTAVNAHMRCDDDTYSADETFTLPSDGSVQVSFDGGSTWYGNADSPRSVGVDIGDLNVAIKLRQHALTGSASGTFSTDGSFVAATALSNVSGFTVTAGDHQNALSWTAVTNRTSYQVDRALDSGFTSGVTLGVYTGTGTSFTDTGLTTGTTYYYRIKAIGTVRYKDSASYATGNGTPYTVTTATFSPSSDGPVSGYLAFASSWSAVRSQSPGNAAYPSATYIPVLARGGSADNPNIFRGHIHFNTASLPDGATIVAARLKLYGSTDSGQAKSNFPSTSAVVLVESLMTAGATPADTDYPIAKFGTTELASRKTHTAWTDDAYNTFDLNASGLALVSKTGTTRFGLREAADVDNSDPGATAHALYCYSVDHATAGKRPVLEVDYV